MPRSQWSSPSTASDIASASSSVPVGPTSSYALLSGAAFVGLCSFSAGLNVSGGVIKVGGSQVLTTPQSVGATLAAATLTGTYATDLAQIQADHDKLRAIELALKAHGLVIT